MRTREQLLEQIVEKQKELMPFIEHNPVCQIMQDWAPAFQALSETPMAYRNEDYEEYFKNL